MSVDEEQADAEAAEEPAAAGDVGDAAQSPDIDDLLRKLGDARRAQGTKGDAASPDADPSSPTLNDRHAQYLAARAINITAALAAGMRSVDPAEGARLLGRGEPLPCGSLAVPYPFVDPIYTRLRLDEPIDGARFLGPGGRPVPIYLSPSLLEAPGEIPIVVVEGAIKAVALVAHGVPAMALGGTGTTLDIKAGHRRLNSSWGLINVAGRETVILFDANRRTNPNVARDEARLAVALEEAGAVVRVADLPRDVGAGEWGPDDFVAARGIDELRGVVGAAVDGDPVKRVQVIVKQTDAAQRAEDAAGLLENLPFLISIIERGTGAEQRVRAALREIKISAKVFDAALGAAKKKVTDANKAAAAATPKVSGQREYEVHEGRICRCFMTEAGMDFAPLTNFSALIEREIVTDDGAEERLRFEIRGALADRSPLPRIVVEAEDFSRMQWPVAKWGARAILQAEPSTPHHVRAAIQGLSSPDRVQVYTHTGFRKIDGKWLYLHGGGALGGEGVLTHLDGPLARYQLPSTIEDPREAVPESTAVFDKGDRKQTFVHGGNSLQERVIPVLTIEHRAAVGASSVQYRVLADALEGVAGMHCKLQPFDAERLRSVALRLRDLFRANDRGRLEQLISDEFIDRLVSEVTTGFKGDVGVVPRQFLREFVTQLDLVEEDPDYVPMEHYKFTAKALSPEEKEALAGVAASVVDPPDGVEDLVPREDVW